MMQKKLQYTHSVSQYFAKDRNKAKDSGMNGYVTKPINYKELFSEPVITAPFIVFKALKTKCCPRLSKI